ncbi:hypothetical protein BCR43DRAFT_77104 [Syncephalastrum racemosum]|uniref:Uncharacterized protein n=1 Tax=Syncephalastrum racemosum TaxID=13706 RepID=A0A1X2H2Q0_SYNRA|nr:hypothetical protein BCR43DRAFT_77104 [Syncephalastrum racemosum]
MGDTRRFSHHASLAELATRLHSKDDREQYARVIAMSKTLQKQILELQRYKAAGHPETTHSAEHDRRRRSASMTMALERERQHQPLDRYYRLLEHSKSLHEQLDRLSNEYQTPTPERSYMDKALPPIIADDDSINKKKKQKAGKQAYAPLINTTVLMDSCPPPTPRSPPPHPPPSCPPPPTPVPSLGTNSNTSKKRAQPTNSHFSRYHYNNASDFQHSGTTFGLSDMPEQEQTPPPTPAKQMTGPTEQQSLLTPPASPQQQPIWSSASSNLTCSNFASSSLTVTTAPTTNPPSLLEEPVPIMRVQRVRM